RTPGSTHMATTTESCTSWLNRLLRGELAAVETYEQALSKCDGQGCAADLRSILQDHRESTAALREHVLHHGGDPDTSSGGWGTWAHVVTGAARVFGTRTTFRALREGEQVGVKEYEAALA